jgi:hypothetical protein
MNIKLNNINITIMQSDMEKVMMIDETKYIMFVKKPHKFNHPFVKSICDCVRIDSYMDTNDEYLNILYKTISKLNCLIRSGWVYIDPTSGHRYKQILGYNPESTILHLCKYKAFLRIDLIRNNSPDCYINYSFKFTINAGCNLIKIELDSL